MKLKELYHSLSFNPYDYEIFYNLSLPLRILSVAALTCFNTVYLIIIHLTLKPFFFVNDDMTFYIFISYLVVIVGSLILFLPIFVSPLRAFKRTITGILRFIVIIIGSLLILSDYLEISSDQFFRALPEQTDYIIGFIGCVLNAFAIIVYAHLMKILTIDNAKKETEIQLAKKIQSQLVPTIFRTEPTFQIYGITNTAFDIGGDFFDVINKEDKKILAVGDSTGHDIAAGLLMAITKGAFRTLVDEDKSFEHLGSSLNKTIKENSDKKMFLTFSSGEFDMKKSTVRFLNAGHMPVLHYNSVKNTIDEINPKGIAFGLLRKSAYDTSKVKFNRGDTFVFMTDGIEEMTNALQEEYGYDRIKAIIQKYAGDYSPKQVYEYLIKDVQIFADFKPFVDDVTFLAIKIL